MGAARLYGRDSQLREAVGIACSTLSSESVQNPSHLLDAVGNSTVDGGRQQLPVTKSGRFHTEILSWGGWPGPRAPMALPLSVETDRLLEIVTAPLRESVELGRAEVEGGLKLRLRQVALQPSLVHVLR